MRREKNKREITYTCDEERRRELKGKKAWS
jgi:hypothetical protein